MDFDYKAEKIGKTISICCTEDHTFGTDAIILFDFADIKRKDRVCDLGTGCGIMGILAAEKSDNTVYGVDIQEKAVRQAELSAVLSGLEGKFKPLEADIKNLSGASFDTPFTAVLCNPPYFKADSGKISSNMAHAIARQEIKCDIKDVVLAASKILCDKGRLCLCNRPDRLVDVISAMREVKIEPKRIQFVKNKKGEAWLFLVEGKKSASSGIQVMKDLNITPGEEYTDTYNRYHREVKNNEG